MDTKLVRIINVGLRSLTLGTRFLFIFFLAKFLDAADVGYYGLFTATVGYTMYFVGLDFYTFATREIINTPNESRGHLLRGQVALCALLYVVLLPVALIFLSQSAWPNHLVWWFLPILLLEHFNQEVFRLLVALSEQITASLILFARQGSWAIVIVTLMAWDPESRNLDMVMGLWLLGGSVAAGFGLWKLTCLNLGGWRLPVDWAWVRRGIQVSMWLLLSTISLRGMQTVDRYWLESLGGIEMVASYVLLLGVAGALMVFLDAGVFSYGYPLLIRYYHNNDRQNARTQLRSMLFQTIGCCVGFAITSTFLLPYLLAWVDNPAYDNSMELYPWLLLAMVLNAIGMVPHYALYASRCDKIIIQSHIAAMVAFVLATWALSGPIGAISVPISLSIAFAIVLLWKSVGYWLVCKQ